MSFFSDFFFFDFLAGFFLLELFFSLEPFFFSFFLAPSRRFSAMRRRN